MLWQALGSLATPKGPQGLCTRSVFCGPRTPSLWSQHGLTPTGPCSNPLSLKTPWTTPNKSFTCYNRISRPWISIQANTWMVFWRISFRTTCYGDASSHQIITAVPGAQINDDNLAHSRGPRNSPRGSEGSKRRHGAPRELPYRPRHLWLCCAVLV